MSAGEAESSHARGLLNGVATWAGRSGELAWLDLIDASPGLLRDPSGAFGSGPGGGGWWGRAWGGDGEGGGGGSSSAANAGASCKKNLLDID